MCINILLGDLLAVKYFQIVVQEKEVFEWHSDKGPSGQETTGLIFGHLIF